MNPLRLPLFRLQLLVAAIATVAVAAPLAAQTGCVAAGCVPPPELFIAGRIFGGFSNGDYYPGQTFTPRFRGVLKEVRLGLQSAGAPNEPTAVIAQIRAVEGAFPTGVVLAQAAVAGAPYGAGNLYAASFVPHNLVLEAGTRYAITLRAGGPNVVYILAAFPGCGAYTGSNDPVHTYDNGLTWSYGWSPAERSFVYEVCVDAATPAVRGTWGRLKTAYR